MSHRKDNRSGWTPHEGGSAGQGEEFDPSAPEPEDVPATTGEPVSHGTPMSRKDYEKLKDEAEHGRSPSNENAQIDPSAC